MENVFVCPNCDSNTYYQRVYALATMIIDSNGKIIQVIDKEVLALDSFECFDCGYRPSARK